jgi:quinol monooxygenase YgiN
VPRFLAGLHIERGAFSEGCKHRKLRDEEIENREELNMIHVVATVRVKPGRRDDFIELVKSITGQVTEEKGCIRYIPTVDIVSGLPPQVQDENLVTMIEAWESLEALRNHLTTPHMALFFEKRKEMVEGGSILKVLQAA